MCCRKFVNFDCFSINTFGETGLGTKQEQNIKAILIKYLRKLANVSYLSDIE